jgi:diadenosine tetraphosphate (Ap4A) HIT family hydrolase
VTTAQAPPEADCPFCAIGRGESASVTVVCESSSWIAFFPDHPATPGHTLVIPRRHVADLWDVDPPLSQELMDAVIRVGRAIESSVHPDGLNLISSAGEPAEQTVFHLHLHIVPRWKADGFGRIWPAKHDYAPAAISEVAERIRAACS